MTLEKSRLQLGMVRLTDAAPLIVARERGFFAAQGLEVELSREPSWANIRDKVALGKLDGAQMPAPMPLAISMGIDGLTVPMATGLALDLGGNAVTVSAALYARLAAVDPAGAAQWPVPASALQRLIAADRAAGRPKPVFAVVHPFSTHNYELRLWLTTGGIDPERDLQLVVVPPPQMVAALSAGSIDGCCVGEPWNSLAVSLALGRILVISNQIWSGRIEKVFAVTAAWAAAHPNTHTAVLRALLGACWWLDQPDNRAEAAELLARPEFLNVPPEVVRRSLLGELRPAHDAVPLALPRLHVFHRHAANFPWRSQAEWYLAQMMRWGQLCRPVDARAIAAQVFRPDLYRVAALALGEAVPLIDRKSEGTHDEPWLLRDATAPIPMAPDAILDGIAFDPDAPGPETDRVLAGEIA